MTAIKVTDSLSNRPEHIVEAAKAIGRSKLKRLVFDAVYYHKKRVKTVTEISAATGLTRMQVLQAAGQLKNSGIFGQERKNGETAYSQIEFFQHNKSKIIRLIDNPNLIGQVQTKRNQVGVAVDGLSFTKKPVRKKTRKTKKKHKSTAPSVRIAFLTTNPSRASSLRTDIEARDVHQAVLKSANRDLVEIRHLPAARVSDLLDALNEFKPNIIHFSGHGGEETLVFDNQFADEDGGIEIDFELVNKIVSATVQPPDLLVFNACDTLDGAEIFLETVSTVVAMASAINDAAACFFSVQFYSAIASGQSIAAALEQGKVVLEVAGMKDSELPSIICAENIDPNSIKFID